MTKMSDENSTRPCALRGALSRSTMTRLCRLAGSTAKWIVPDEHLVRTGVTERAAAERVGRCWMSMRVTSASAGTATSTHNARATVGSGSHLVTSAISL